MLGKTKLGTESQKKQASLQQDTFMEELAEARAWKGGERYESELKLIWI